MKAVRAQLVSAAARKEIVRIERSGLEGGLVDGFVAKCGADVFVLEVLDDSVRLNGFSCMRYTDVSSCEAPSPREAFQRRVLALRGQSRRPPNLISDAATLGSVLEDARRSFPLVALFREAEAPDICFIGAIAALSDAAITLREITPDGVWESAPRVYPLSEITRLDFGGAYEEALFLGAVDR